MLLPKTLSRSRPRLTGIWRRLVFGLLLTVFAIVSGWVLVPPEAGTDQATVDWYSR